MINLPTKIEMSVFARYGSMKGVAKWRKWVVWGLVRYIHNRSILIPRRRGSPWDDLRKILQGSQRMARIGQLWRNITERFNPRFPRRKTYSKGIADLFQIDLVDLSNLATFNDGMRYLLKNPFTKRAWAVPVRTNSARDVVATFEKLPPIKSAPWCTVTKAPSFWMRLFSPCCVVMAYTFTQAKTKIWKPLKDMMFRYFTHQNTRRRRGRVGRYVAFIQ